MDVAAWLRGLGLERYAPAFRDNDVDGEVLPELTAEDLIAIGDPGRPSSQAPFRHRRARRRGAGPSPSFDSDTGIGAVSRTGASPGRAPLAPNEPVTLADYHEAG